MNQRKGVVRHIPNFITCLNLFSGCIASLMAIEGYLIIASLLIVISAFLDFMDGFTARILKTYSPIGKDLDSLADIISFGFAPGAIAFAYLKLSVLNDLHTSFNPTTLTVGELILLFSAFIIPVFSGLRLAKFNVDTRQTSSFIGMPTPANAIFWASIPLTLHWGNYPDIEKYISNPFIVVPVIIITSLLLVIEFPMFALKIKNLSWKDNKIRYGFLISLVIIAIFFQWLAIPMTIVMYILFSVIDNLLKKPKTD